MATFWIRYGLGGGSGDWEAIEARTEDEAFRTAYEAACEVYDSYGGLHGLRTMEDIMDEEGVDEAEAEMILAEDRESWLEYEVSSVEPGEND